MPEPQRLVGAAEVASWYGVRRKTVRNWLAYGNFPPPVAIVAPSGVPGWSPRQRTDIGAWLGDRTGYQPRGVTLRLHGTGIIAGWFEVQTITVDQWLTRHIGFPLPDYVVSSGKGGVPGWLPGREGEIRTWHANRGSGDSPTKGGRQ